MAAKKPRQRAGLLHTDQPELRRELAELVPVLFFQLAKGTIPKLADPLPRNPQHAADLLQGLGVTVVQAEVEPKHLRVPGW